MGLWVALTYPEVSLPLSNIFERLWQLGKATEDWRRANAAPLFTKGENEDLGNYRLVSLVLIAGKVAEQLILGAISRHVKDEKVIKSSQQGMTEGKSHLTNLVSSTKS